MLKVDLSLVVSVCEIGTLWLLNRAGLLPLKLLGLLLLHNGPPCGLTLRTSIPRVSLPCLMALVTDDYELCPWLTAPSNVISVVPLCTKFLLLDTRYVFTYSIGSFTSTLECHTLCYEVLACEYGRSSLVRWCCADDSDFAA